MTSPPIETFFRELGQRIAARWGRLRYAPAALPPVAAELLAEARTHEHFGLDDLLRWTLTAESLSPQQFHDSGFGQPPIELFHHERFFVQALVWRESTTDVHQHAFSGAWSVWLGGSVHAVYRFEEQELLGEGAVRGTLTCERVEVLRPGDARPIVEGRGFLHALYHLEHPSVSLVARTPGAQTTGPQYSYAPPHFGFDPHLQRPSLTVRKRVLETALGLKNEAALASVPARLRRCDAFEAWQLLTTLDDRPEGAALVREAFEALEEGHGAAHASVIKEALLERRHTLTIAALRRKVRDADDRFVLALLLNVQDLATIERLVAERWPDRDPREVLLDTVDRAAATYDPRFAATPADARRAALRALVEGRSGPHEASASSAELPQREASRLLMFAPHHPLFRRLVTR